MMASTPNYQQQYLKAKVETASPGDLTLLLYEELHRKLNMARVLYEKGQVPEMMDRLHGARSILYEFIATLNFQYEISHQLRRLYDYYIRRIGDFAVNKDISVLDEVIEFAREYTDTWRQALTQVKSAKGKS